MSVQSTVQAVHRFATTLQAATTAPVMQDSASILTTIPAMVRWCECIYIYLYNYTLIPTADVNECMNSNGGCAQICNNTIGSYECSCRNGYNLADDFHRCDGMSMMKVIGAILSPLITH